MLVGLCQWKHVIAPCTYQHQHIRSCVGDTQQVEDHQRGEEPLAQACPTTTTASNHTCTLRRVHATSKRHGCQHCHTLIATTIQVAASRRGGTSTTVCNKHDPSDVTATTPSQAVKARLTVQNLERVRQVVLSHLPPQPSFSLQGGISHDPA